VSARASVVVVTWQGRHLLEPCLDALAAQTLGPDEFDVVVVDNASTDGTAELLARRPAVRVATAARNLGFAGGATLGLNTVTTPYAVVLNNDAVPDPDWLEQLLAGFAPGVGAVTSKVVLEPRYVLLELASRPEVVRRVLVDGVDVTGTVVARATPSGVELAVPARDAEEVDAVVLGYEDDVLHNDTVPAGAPRVDVLNSTGGLLTATGHGADRGYLEVDRGQYDEDLDVFAVCGAAAAFRTDLGLAAGWFDPWLFAYYEDLDLSWRLRRAGWAVRYAPSARVRHRHAATSRVGSDLFLFHNRRNRLAVLTRNASAHQLAGVLAALRRPRPVPAAELLPWGLATIVPGPRVRGRAVALGSFLVRLPRLLRSRRTHRVPPPTAAGDRGS
jgi:GT2 family glycosyltransferase